MYTELIPIIRINQARQIKSWVSKQMNGSRHVCQAQHIMSNRDNLQLKRLIKLNPQINIKSYDDNCLHLPYNITNKHMTPLYIPIHSTVE